MRKKEEKTFYIVSEILRKDWGLLEKMGPQATEESPWWVRDPKERISDEREALKTVS